jgi:hypothetical protein
MNSPLLHLVRSFLRRVMRSKPMLQLSIVAWAGISICSASAADCSRYPTCNAPGHPWGTPESTQTYSDPASAARSQAVLQRSMGCRVSTLVPNSKGAKTGRFWICNPKKPATPPNAQSAPARNMPVRNATSAKPNDICAGPPIPGTCDFVQPFQGEQLASFSFASTPTSGPRQIICPGTVECEVPVYKGCVNGKRTPRSVSLGVVRGEVAVACQGFPRGCQTKTAQECVQDKSLKWMPMPASVGSGSHRSKKINSGGAN